MHNPALEQYHEQQQLAEIYNREQKERERVFSMYLDHLGLTIEDLKGKEILDVGAGHGDFADQSKQLGLDSKVISIDTRKIQSAGLEKNDNIKLGHTNIEDLNLKNRLNLEEEPRFDLILSNNSAPYTLVNENQDNQGHWAEGNDRIWHEEMDINIQKTFNSVVSHLDVGGEAIIYPIFNAEIVDFGPGGKRDFRDWRKILDEKLSTLLEDQYRIEIEEVKKELGHSYQRLKITKIA